MGIMQDQILEYSGLWDAGKNGLGRRNMEGKVSYANLAILDPMAKTVCCSGMQFGRYRWAAPSVEIYDPTVKMQAYLHKIKRHKVR